MSIATMVRSIARDAHLRTVVLFSLGCLVGFGFLWVKSGGQIPFVAEHPDYRATFVTDEIQNLREFGEVRIAGVRVGRVESIDRTRGRAKVEISVEDGVAPLHDGANVRIAVKSLVGSSFIEVIDGTGPELHSGARLANVTPAIDVDELLDTLDAPTREHLKDALQSLGRAADGREADVDQVMAGLGYVGNEGYTVVDAIARQSDDLEDLTREARILMDDFDAGRGAIADLVGDAQRLTQATADNQDDLEESVQLLPSVVGRVDTAADSLEELAEPLDPVAEDLREAAPHLSSALVNLRPVTRDLRGLVPDLDATLDAAPATLSRVPAFAGVLSDVSPEVRELLRDLSPMLAYLKPYGLDLGVMFSNFGASMDIYAEDGVNPVKLTASAQGIHMIRGNPVKIVSHENKGTGFWNNPYPLPGYVDKPQPYGSGAYPRIERAK